MTGVDDAAKILFMHYAFGTWLEREFPAVKFERFAGDAVVHCATEQQAREVLAALEQRMAEAGLQLHPDKTKIVYCKDGKRRQPYDGPCLFTFLSYAFRARSAPAKDRTSMFTGFLPAVSKDVLKEMNEEARSWRIHLRTTSDLAELAKWINPVVSGWMNCYGGFYRTGPEPPATAHQHLPGALGTTKVQAAQSSQTGQEVAGQADRKTAAHVRPLGLDDRILEQPIDLAF